jgi:hypothetical protein
MQEALRKASTPLVALLLAATLFAAYSVGTMAFATHQPADKVNAVGDDLDIMGPGDNIVILEETMRVSSPSDLLLQVTAECSILTALVNPGSSTGGASDTQNVEGTVKIYITVDGNRVPVAYNDSPTDASGTPSDDFGEVVFCNREYQRTIADREEDEGGSPGGDGYDEERDYIRTRTANAFNWVALNSGFDYDVGNDNVLDIKVWAEFERTNDEACPFEDGAPTETCSEAFVGSRTLIVEPVHAQNDETVGPGPAEASPPGGKK